jgi:hypothetical protein
MLHDVTFATRHHDRKRGERLPPQHRTNGFGIHGVILHLEHRLLPNQQ